jgi:hypothetical protein
MFESNFKRLTACEVDEAMKTRNLVGDSGYFHLIDKTWFCETDVDESVDDRKAPKSARRYIL